MLVSPAIDKHQGADTPSCCRRDTCDLGLGSVLIKQLRARQGGDLSRCVPARRREEDRVCHVSLFFRAGTGPEASHRSGQKRVEMPKLKFCTLSDGSFLTGRA